VARVAGEQFGSYLIEGAIGASQMSDVYVAVDQVQQRRVALKIMSASLSENPRFRERFRREAQAASLIDHPNVLPIYDSGDVDGTMFLAMRLVDGLDLRDVLLERTSITSEETVRLLRQAALGLDAAHARGVVHRDVKPDNFLIEHHAEPEERLFVCDFGIAFREVDARLTMAGEAFGTLGYTAPEQMRSEVVGPAADVFSLGCVAYECLSGSVPAFLDGVPVALRDLRPELAALPAPVDAFFARCLTTDPGARYRTCGEAIEVLERCLTGVEVAVDDAVPLAGAAETRRITLLAASTLAEEWAVARTPSDAPATVTVPAGQLPSIAAPDRGIEVGGAAAAGSSRPARPRTVAWVGFAVVVVVVLGAIGWRATSSNIDAAAPTPATAVAASTPGPVAGSGTAPTNANGANTTSSVAKAEVLADRDPSTACNGCGPRGRVVMNGQRLFHAIAFPSLAAGVPKSSTYAIGGAGATRLQGTMGIDDESETKAAVVMVVVGDGRVLLRQTVKPGEAPRIDVDIAGVDQLELEVEPPPAFASGAACCVSAIWGDLTLAFT